MIMQCPQDRLLPALSRALRARPVVTTHEFAALHDHARLPGRFFGRLTTAANAQLTVI
jgi:hypothetical protein